MWRMLQNDAPEDFVLATGRTHTVEEFCALAFAKAELPLEFSGTGPDRQGRDPSGVVRVRIDPTYYRPTEVDLLLGDPTKARELLGWEAHTNLETLASIMVKHDLALAEEEARNKAHRS
jgi:GDPmannose 4,6-dehydratase